MVKQPITRREFIGTTAVAGAGLLLTSCSPDSKSTTGATTSSNKKKLNIALIGCGAEGQVLLDSLTVIEGLNLVALVDIWDYNLNSNNIISGSFSYFSNPQIGPVNGGANSQWPQLNVNVTNHPTTSSIRYTRIFKATLLNEAEIPPNFTAVAPVKFAPLTVTREPP